MRTTALASFGLAVLLGATTACGDQPAAAPAAAPTTKQMTETTAKQMTDTTAKQMTDGTAKQMTDGTAKQMTDGTAKQMTDGTGAAMMGPSWTHLALVDVDGHPLTLADFMGKPVFVEHFATWCPKCKTQLKQTQAAAAQIGGDAVVIALSLETDLDRAKVAKYRDDNGFTNVRFAVMTPEFLAAVSGDLGNDSINAPSTPHYVIDAHGMPKSLATGPISAADIVAGLRTAKM